MPELRIPKALDATLGSILRALPDTPAVRGAGARALLDLDAHLLQLIDGVVAGFTGDPPSSDADDLRPFATIVIDVFDSTHWTIYAEDPTLLTPVAHAHPTAQPLEPEVPMPAWHGV